AREEAAHTRGERATPRALAGAAAAADDAAAADVEVVAAFVLLGVEVAVAGDAAVERGREPERAQERQLEDAQLRRAGVGGVDEGEEAVEEIEHARLRVVRREQLARQLAGVGAVRDLGHVEREVRE